MATPSAKQILADEAKFNEMTEAAYNKAGGGASVSKSAIREALEQLGKASGKPAPSADHKAKFEAAAQACGLSMDGSASLDEFRADFKKVFAKLAESE